MSVFVAVFVWLCGFLRFSNAQLTWQEVVPLSSVAPSPRVRPAIGYDPSENVLLVFGGQTDGGVLDDTWIFNFTSKLWKEIVVTGTKPGARYTAIGDYYVASNWFIISSGEGSGKTFFDDIWRLDYKSVTPQWVRLDASANVKPEERYGSGGGLIPNTNKFLLSHGFAARRFSNTFLFEIGSSSNWKETFEGTNEYNPSEPHARCLVASTDYHSGLVLFGGCLNAGFSGGPCPSFDCWTYNINNKEWKRMDDGPIPSVFSDMAVYYGDSNKVLLYGGRQDQTLQKIGGNDIKNNEIHVLHINRGTWDSYKTLNSPSNAIAKHRMLNTGHSMILFGGQYINNGERLNKIFELTGNINSNDLIKSSSYSYFSVLYLHGILMWLSWGLLLQIGGFFGRFFRHKDPFWFRPMHLYCQRSGFVINLFGFICAFIGGGVPAFAHGAIGIIIFLLSCFQVIWGEFRPHHGQPYRWLFEILHPWSGRTALLLSLINISLGVFLILAPSPVYILWFIEFGIIFVLYILFELNKRGIIYLPFLAKESQDKHKKKDEDKDNHNGNTTNDEHRKLDQSPSLENNPNNNAVVEMEDQNQ